jgi:hypothetical protein
MKYLKYLALLCVVAVSAAMLSACDDQPSNPPPPAPAPEPMHPNS